MTALTLRPAGQADTALPTRFRFTWADIGWGCPRRGREGKAASDHVTAGVREAVSEFGEAGTVAYGRQVVRLAGLLHDVGHLPFSRAVEHDVFPGGRSHEDQ